MHDIVGLEHGGGWLFIQCVVLLVMHEISQHGFAAKA